MKEKRVSLQDIANLTGVTKMTVSRYLRDPDSVSLINKAKIAAVLEEIHYIPNRAPEILLGSRSKSLGILIPSFQNQIFTDVLAGIESVTTKHRYQTLITNYNYDPLIEEDKVINLLSYNIDALILMEKRHTKRTLKYLKSANIPVAELMDITPSCIDIQVGFNNEQAAYDIAIKLLENGKRHIIYFNAIANERDQQRYQGYCRALSVYGLTPYQIQPNSVSSINLGRQLFQQAIQRYPEMDGVLCTNDDMAVGVLLECQSYQIPVPQQIAIAGFHGLEVGQANIQTVATVVTPRFAIGETVTELLLKRISGEQTPSTVELDYHLALGDTLLDTTNNEHHNR